MFDPETDQWSQLPSFSFSLAFFSVVSHKDSIYIFGGMSAHGQCNDVTYVFREGGSEWEVCTSMPTRRYAAKAFVSQDHIYVLGGRVLMNPSNAVETFDTVSGTWSKHPDGLVNRMFPAMVEMDGCIYVMGGLTTAGEFLGEVELFHTSKKTLVNVTPLHSKRADMSAGEYRLTRLFMPVLTSSIFLSVAH